MLDLNEVRMFVQVIRARSFAEAARRLGVPSNTLSRRVRQLESRLDTRLMQRSTRKLTLTAAGQQFFERCAPAVDGVLNAGKELQQGSHTPSGIVRVAAPAGFLDLLPIGWITEFLRIQPQIQLEFVLDDARADLIGDGFDVAFRGGPLDESTTTHRRISTQYFNLVASPEYVALHGAPRNLRALGSHQCLVASGRQARTSWVLEGPDGSTEVKVTGRFRANSAQVLLKACLAGLGVGLLPSILTLPELNAGRLVRLLPEYRRDGANLNVLVPSNQQIPAAVTAFIEFAAEKLQSITAEQQVLPVVRRRRRNRGRV